MNKNILIVMGILVLLFLPSAWAWDTNPTTNLVSYWKMEETGAIAPIDYFGNGNGLPWLAYSSGCTTNCLTTVPGVILQGTKFGPPSSLSMLDNQQQYNMNAGEDFTVNFWLQDSYPYDEYYFTKGWHGVWVGLVIRSAKDRNMEFGAGFDLVRTTNGIPEGPWFMFTAVRDGNDYMIYINGVLNNTLHASSSVSTVTPTSCPAFWASRGCYGTVVDVADANIDEAGFWKRALSAADISTMYNSGAGKTYCTQTGTYENYCGDGLLSIQIKDEDTWEDLNGASVTVAGTTYSVTGSNIDINLAGYSPGYYNVVFSKNGYSTRSYQYLFTGQTIVIPMLLAKNIQSLNEQFKFKVPGSDINYARSTYVSIVKSSPTGNEWTIGRYLTDANGYATLNIDANDQNYITRFTYLGKDWNINPIRFTVNKPKDEATDLNINANFNASFSNAYNDIYDDLNLPLSIYIIPNTVNAVDMWIDSNNLLYSSRGYVFNFTSDDNATVFTPYLALTSMTGGNVNFITNTQNRDVLPYVTFKIYRVINGARVQIQGGMTDVTGSRLFNFINGASYSIDVYYKNATITTAYLYQATATPVYWYLEIGPNTFVVQQYFIQSNVTFTPTGPQLLGSVTTINVLMAADNLSQYSYIIYQYNDINHMTGIKIFQSPPSSPCAGSSCTATISLPNMDTNKSFFIDINVFYNNGTTSFHAIHTYTKTAQTNMDIFVLARGMRKDFGCTTSNASPCALGMILSVILTIVALAVLIRMTGMNIGIGTLVITMILLGLFTYVYWFSWEIYLILMVGAVLAAASGFIRGGQ
jgi:hypothetical protein